MVTPSTAVNSKGSRKSLITKVLFSSATWKIAIFLIFAIEIRSVFEMWAPVYISELKRDTTTFKECSILFELGGIIGSFSSGVIVQMLEQRYGKEIVRWNFASLCTGIMLVSAFNFFQPDVSLRVTKESTKFASFFSGIKRSTASSWVRQLMHVLIYTV